MSVLVGLTGGIASGKSTVCRLFLELGSHLVDADQVSRDLVELGSPVSREIVEAFGSGVLLEGGELDRKKLADIIFGDPEKRLILEKILHPPILNEVARRVRELEREHPGGIIVVDAALMIEVGLHEDFEKLIVVFADERTQVRRLIERDRISESEARRRIEAQMPLSEKIEYADYVIDNNGSPEKTKEEVVRIYKELRTLGGGTD